MIKFFASACMVWYEHKILSTPLSDSKGGTSKIIPISNWTEPSGWTALKTPPNNQKFRKPLWGFEQPNKRKRELLDQNHDLGTCYFSNKK